MIFPESRTEPESFYIQSTQEKQIELFGVGQRHLPLSLPAGSQESENQHLSCQDAKLFYGTFGNFLCNVKIKYDKNPYL